MFVIADTMNLWIDTTPDLVNQLIKRVNLIVINDEETAEEALEKARELLPQTESMNHYQVLGLTVGASMDRV